MNIGTMFSKIGFWGKRHSPELPIASGILLSAAAIASAIYSTTKVNETEWKHIEDIMIAAGELKEYAPYDKLIYNGK